MTLHRSDRLDQFEAALASIENQRDFEGPTHVYLCIDGPLPPAHRAWFRANFDRFYRVVTNDEAQGLGTSLNALIDCLDDEAYVFRMDGDDLSHPDRFARQISYLEANPTVDLIGCQVIDIDDFGNVLSGRRFPIDHEECVRSLRAVIPLLHPTFCFRRGVLRDPRLRYPAGHLAEDLAFIVTLVECGLRIGNSDETLFSWRQGQSFFQRRRSLARGIAELRWYARAIRSRRGLVTLDYLYPVARLLLRLLPPQVQRFIYGTSLRSRLVAEQTEPAW